MRRCWRRKKSTTKVSRRRFCLASSATSLQEWRSSWAAFMLAAEHPGLLLARTFPYDPRYYLSSHRGTDRPLNLGKDPTMHVFVRPDGVPMAPREVQLYCRHELHAVLPYDDDDDDDGTSPTAWDWGNVVQGNAIERLIRDRCVPDGIRVEVPATSRNRTDRRSRFRSSSSCTAARGGTSPGTQLTSGRRRSRRRQRSVFC